MLLPAPTSAERRADDRQAFVQRHAAHFDRPPLDPLHHHAGPRWEAIVGTVVAAEAGLTETLARLRHDLIVLDNLVKLPALARAS